MSDKGKAKPFTPADREAKTSWATWAVKQGTIPDGVQAKAYLCWEAALRQAETALAEITRERDELLDEVEGAYEAHAEIVAERDAYRAFFAWWLGPDTFENFYSLMPMHGDMDDDETARFRVALDAVKALEVTP